MRAEREMRLGLRAAVIPMLGVVVVGLAACSNSPKTSTSVTSTVSASNTVSAAAGSSSAQTTPVSASAEDCGGAVSRVTAAVSSFVEVTKVQTIAACHEVDILTNLPSGVLGSPSATKGAEICDAAAKVAYQGDVSSITVTATDGHELAAGLKSAGCIPG